ncbi:MAG TPA: IclR family transcriptional regulator [Microbacterium sp.]|nr:IclR family transcriptional regulator [Microbacterium sp.]
MSHSDDPSPESVNSLDRGLRLLQALRDFGTIRVTDAADQLGVSRSTAHRLLSTLVRRGFAIQDDGRLYRPGPALEAGPARLEWAHELRLRCRPHLARLAERSGDSANLMIRLGVHIRFLSTVRAESPDATLDREGTVMLAHHASGGKALLAELDPDRVAMLFGGREAARLPAQDRPALSALHRELAGVRSRGFATNEEQTERNVLAVGVTIHDHTGDAIGAVSLSARLDRGSAPHTTEMAALLSATRDDIERDLASHPLRRRPER